MAERTEAHRRAVEGLHGGEATFEWVEHGVERHDGETVWEGDIYVFTLDGIPAANRCYAWSEPVEGSDCRRFFAVLHRPPVTSVALALRASIMKDVRGKDH